MKLRRTKNGTNFIVPIFWATLYIKDFNKFLERWPWPKEQWWEVKSFGGDFCALRVPVVF